MRWDDVEKQIRRWIYGDHSMDDARARMAYHRLANEAQSLKARLGQIQRAPDPWHELVKAIRGGDHHNGAGH